MQTVNPSLTDCLLHMCRSGKYFAAAEWVIKHVGSGMDPDRACCAFRLLSTPSTFSYEDMMFLFFDVPSRWDTVKLRTAVQANQAKADADAAFAASPFAVGDAPDAADTNEEYSHADGAASDGAASDGTVAQDTPNAVDPGTCGNAGPGGHGAATSDGTAAKNIPDGHHPGTCGTKVGTSVTPPSRNNWYAALHGIEGVSISTSPLTKRPSVQLKKIGANLSRLGHNFKYNKLPPLSELTLPSISGATRAPPCHRSVQRLLARATLSASNEKAQEDDDKAHDEKDYIEFES